MELICSSQKLVILFGNYPYGKITKINLSSAHADFKNIGNSMFGGAITAALFLEKFVKNIPVDSY